MVGCGEVLLLALIMLKLWQVLVRWILGRRRGVLEEEVGGVMHVTAEMGGLDDGAPSGEHPAGHPGDMPRRLSLPRSGDWDDARRPTPEEYERMDSTPLVATADQPSPPPPPERKPALQEPTPQRRPYWQDPMAPPPIKIHTTPDPFIDDVPSTPLEQREFASPVFMGAALHTPDESDLKYPTADLDLDTQRAWEE